MGLTALRAMVDVEPYGSSDLGGDPSVDEPPSMTSASPSEDDDPEDPENPRGRKKKKKKRKSKRHEGRRSQEAKAIATSKIVVNFPEFTGKDLSKFPDNFRRFLRMTGLTCASGRVKCDLLLKCCKTKYLEKQVKQILTKSATFADMLVDLERQYPYYETDVSIRAEIQNLAALPNNPKPARISQLLADLDHLVGRLKPGSYGSDGCYSGWWLSSREKCEMNAGQRQSARQEPSPTRIFLCYFWSWRWKKKANSTRMPTVLEEAALAMAEGTKHPDLDRGLPAKHARFMSNVQDLSGVMPETSRVACFMPLTVTSGTVSWSRGRSRRTTPEAKPRCRTTTGAQSPVRSVGRGGTTRTSANISNAFQGSSRPRTPVARAVARATPTRTVARASPRAMAKAKVARAKVDEEALTASLTRTRMRTGPEGTPILYQGGTLCPLVGNQTRDLQPVPRHKHNRNKGLSVPTKMGTPQTPANVPVSCAWRGNYRRRGLK